MEFLNERSLHELVQGGAVLGGGGGGSIEAALRAGEEALSKGRPRLVRIEELSPASILVTLSVVGSVTGMGADQALPRHDVALRRLAELDKRTLGALIHSEVGPQAVTYGWKESAASNIPIADAPCNGRAHPLGVMGSLGLHHHPGYKTCAAAIASTDKQKPGTELMLRGSVNEISQVIRKAAAMLHAPFAVARNPLTASYVRMHAAVGGLRYARNIGKIVLNERGYGLQRVLARLAQWTGGRVIGYGRVQASELRDEHGFTLGRILIKDRSGYRCSVHVCNEYMTYERDRRRIATFPDLITLFDLERVRPLSSAEVRNGNDVAVFAVPRAKLKLGSPMSDQNLLRQVEKLLRVRLISTTRARNADHEVRV